MAPGTSGQHRTLGKTARPAHAQRNQYPDAAPAIRGGAATRGAQGTQVARKSQPGSPLAPQGVVAPQAVVASQGKTMTGASVYEALAAASQRAAGCSQKEEVWQSGKLRLYRYQP